jgi:hypothetical protein
MAVPRGGMPASWVDPPDAGAHTCKARGNRDRERFAPTSCRDGTRFAQLA